MRSRAPYRPNSEISQQFNDGTVTIYAVSDGAKPGYQPEKTATKKFNLRYADRKLGLTRIYQARQNHVEILKVIRVPRVGISTKDIAVTHDGIQYDIDTVQEAMGVYPSSLDLSLKAITHRIEVLPE